jgi:transposase-like protein
MVQLASETKEPLLTTLEDTQDVLSQSTQEPMIGSTGIRASRRPKVSPEDAREIARLYADTTISTAEIRARFGIGESSLYRVVQQQGTPLRGRMAATKTPAAPSTKKGGKRVPAAARQATTTARRAGDEGAGTNAQGRHRRPAPRATNGQHRTSAVMAVAQPSSTGARFRIRFHGERVFVAQTIQDALRQAESLGATEITGVTRED